MLIKRRWKKYQAFLAEKGTHNLKLAEDILALIDKYPEETFNKYPRDLLRIGLFIGKVLSDQYYFQHNAKNCVRIAEKARRMAEALERSLDELILIERITFFAGIVGMDDDSFREITQRAEELAQQIIRSTPGYADEARYHYCFIASYFSRRVRDLKFIENVENMYARQISNSVLRYKALHTLLGAKADLLLSWGLLNDAINAIEERKR